jgi:cell division septation protein DedD
MRDVERLRERRQFSLDDRQVVALAICALLLLSGVFSLGVLIGKKTAPSAELAAAGLAALDAQARRPEARTAPHPEPAKAPPPPAAPNPPSQPPAERPAPVRAASVIPPPPRSATVIPPPSRPVQVAAPALPALAPPPRDLGEFTVQVGASQDRGEAARLESRVRSSGLRPYVVEAKLGRKGTWYRIRVGAFRDRESAMRFRKDVERELRTVAVVMPTR